MRIVIIATEASGDFLGSELIKAIRLKKKNVIIKGIGGPLMINSMFKSFEKWSNKIPKKVDQHYLVKQNGFCKI